MAIIRVMLVDDSPLFLGTLKAAIEKEALAGASFLCERGQK